MSLVKEHHVSALLPTGERTIFEDGEFPEPGELVHFHFGGRGLGLVLQCNRSTSRVRVLWPDSAPKVWNPCTEIKIMPGKLEFISINFTVEKCGT